jgi:hypothetical protein
MSKRPSGEYSEGPADYRLPASITRGIGRIVVRWAYFEWYLQTIIWRLAGLMSELAASRSKTRALPKG